MSNQLTELAVIIIFSVLTYVVMAYGIISYIMKKKDLTQTEIEIRLKNRNSVLPTVLTILTIFVTIIIFVFNQSNSTLNSRYSTITAQINQLETVSIKQIEYLPKNEQKQELDNLSKKISTTQNEAATTYNETLTKSNYYLNSIVGGTVAIIFFIIIAIFSQVIYTRTLYKKLENPK